MSLAAEKQKILIASEGDRMREIACLCLKTIKGITSRVPAEDEFAMRLRNCVG